MRLNTEQLIYNLVGQSKSFVKRVEKQQEEKYGNYDIFEVNIKDENDIEVCFGENWIEFFFNSSGVVVDTLGTGQGHKYHKNLQQIAEELRVQYLTHIIVL